MFPRYVGHFQLLHIHQTIADFFYCGALSNSQSLRMEQGEQTLMLSSPVLHPGALNTWCLSCYAIMHTWSGLVSFRKTGCCTGCRYELLVKLNPENENYKLYYAQSLYKVRSILVCFTGQHVGPVLHFCIEINRCLDASGSWSGLT